MKKNLLFISLSLITSLLSAQSLGYYESISFDSPHPMYISINIPDSIILKIDTSTTGNIWQIGKPLKTIFDSTYSYPNAIVTDTSHYYPPNNFSAFTVKIFDPAWTGFYINDVEIISFKHKFDTDSLQDGGYVEVSYNNGITWTNIANDTMGWWDPYFYSQDNDPNPIIANGNAAFTGSSDGWLQSAISGCNRTILSNPLPVYLRFVFSSDSNIDICLGCGNCLGIKDAQNKELISIYPNPAIDYVNIQLEQTYIQDLVLDIYNALGQRVYQTIIPKLKKEVKVDLKGFEKGLFFLVLRDGYDIIGSGKFVKD